LAYPTKRGKKMTTSKVLDEKTFLTEYEGEDGKYTGPHIKARTWEEAQAKAKEALIVYGKLESTFSV
jgi:hypothetical protein